MKKLNSKIYVISWGNGNWSDLMSSLKECENLIQDFVSENALDSCEIDDIVVYEVSATYTVKSKGISLHKE